MAGCPVMYVNVGENELFSQEKSYFVHYFMQEHSLKMFSLALLGIKILFLYIMLESIF